LGGRGKKGLVLFFLGKRGEPASFLTAKTHRPPIFLEQFSLTNTGGHGGGGKGDGKGGLTTRENTRCRV